MLPAHLVLLWPRLGGLPWDLRNRAGLLALQSHQNFLGLHLLSVRRAFSNKLSAMWRFLRQCHMKCLSHIYLAGACLVLREKAQVAKKPC